MLRLVLHDSSQFAPHVLSTIHLSPQFFGLRFSCHCSSDFGIAFGIYSSVRIKPEHHQSVL